MEGMSTFDESQHSRDNAGKFTEMAGSEQADVLTAPNPVAAFDAGAFQVQRSKAAALFVAAQTAYHQTNRDAAAAVLRAHFPWATTAVFAQGKWANLEHQIVLTRLLGAEQELDFYGDGATEWGEKATHGQLVALNDARVWIGQMGENISAHLDPGDDRDGWHEHRLSLADGPTPDKAAGSFIDQLEETSRNEMYFELSERDGRLPSIVDTREIVYQLEEGFVQDMSPNLAEAIVTKFGSVEAAAQAISDSGAWYGEREEIATRLQTEMPFAIRRAATAVLNEKS